MIININIIKYYFIFFEIIYYIIMRLTIILSFIAIMLTVLNTILIVGKSHIDKNVSGFNESILFTSFIIAIIWCIYGYIDNKQYILIGYLIIIICMMYLLYLYYYYKKSYI